MLKKGDIIRHDDDDDNILWLIIDVYFHLEKGTFTTIALNQHTIETFDGKPWEWQYNKNKNELSAGAEII